MSGALEQRVRAVLAGSRFAGRSGDVATLLAAAPDAESSLERFAEPLLAGLARAAATNPEQARFAIRRRGLLARAAELDGSWPLRRAAQLDAEVTETPADLEDFLDGIRLLRREEMLLAACVDFAGLADFEDVSQLLSALAEAIVRRALGAAARSLRGPAPLLAVVAMGKLGGREFTYHSDLDLIFLGEGGVEAVHAASRIAQRLISYVATTTGAGFAYAVDSRLRPSGSQGMLVTSFDGFEAYQSAEAATWEYLALVRARAIAGARDAAAKVLERVKQRAFGRGGRWDEVADMRARIEAERAGRVSALELKTGAGGLMDVEFLTEGAVLEKGGAEGVSGVPSIPGLLRTCAGPAAEEVLRHYRLLRRVESRMRWCAGRAVESLERSDPRLGDVADLVEPGLDVPGLIARIDASRAGIRGAFEAVVRAATIEALR
jgi:glutamate-ammonia-ligase adenylyltransferase